METDLVSITEFTQRETAAKEYFSAANKARDDVDAVRSNIPNLTPLFQYGSDSRLRARATVYPKAVYLARSSVLSEAAGAACASMSTCIGACALLPAGHGCGDCVQRGGQDHGPDPAGRVPTGHHHRVRCGSGAAAEDADDTQGGVHGHATPHV